MLHSIVEAHLNFSLPQIVSRKRRRVDDLETQSCLNMSLKVCCMIVLFFSNHTCLFQEPRHKRLRRPLAKAFSPIVKRAKNTIKVLPLGRLVDGISHCFFRGR